MNADRKRLELKQKKDPLQLPIKLILNSIYGKAGQKVNRVIGNLFNPVIFSFITGYTRARLYRFVIENKLEKDVVYMHTDSVCTTKDLGIDSDRLGEFSFKGQANDIFCLQNGINRFNGEWKERGIGNMGGRRIENYKIYEENGRVIMKLRVERVKNIKSAIIQNKIAEIGKFHEATRVINLNADRKRLWLGEIKSIDSGEYNDSMPLSLNQFSKDEI